MCLLVSGHCIAKDFILHGETFARHHFSKIAAHTLILYDVNSLTDNIILLYVGWDWTSCENSFLMAWGYKWEGRNTRRKDKVIKCLGIWMWQQNMWAIFCVIYRESSTAYARKNIKMARSACELQRCNECHNSHLSLCVYFFALLKTVGCSWTLFFWRGEKQLHNNACGLMF